MTDIPRVWWLPETEEYCEHLAWREPGDLDQLRCEDGWHNEDGEHAAGIPDDATPLVPQVSRDELREAIERTVQWHVEMMQEPGIADRVLDLLADRGLVARPNRGEAR